MGPPLNRGGDPVDDHALLGALEASMGPPLNRGGDRLEVLASAAGVLAFNGAAAESRRRRGRPAHSGRARSAKTVWMTATLAEGRLRTIDFRREFTPR